MALTPEIVIVQKLTSATVEGGESSSSYCVYLVDPGNVAHRKNPTLGILLHGPVPAEEALGYVFGAKSYWKIEPDLKLITGTKASNAYILGAKFCGNTLRMRWEDMPKDDKSAFWPQTKVEVAETQSA